MSLEAFKVSVITPLALALIYSLHEKWMWIPFGIIGHIDNYIELSETGGHLLLILLMMTPWMIATHLVLIKTMGG